MSHGEKIVQCGGKQCSLIRGNRSRMNAGKLGTNQRNMFQSFLLMGVTKQLVDGVVRDGYGRWCAEPKSGLNFLEKCFKRWSIWHGIRFSRKVVTSGRVGWDASEVQMEMERARAIDAISYVYLSSVDF